MKQSQTTRKYRWFLPWQDELEENWLCQMANEGFHLVELKSFGRYYFRCGEPEEAIYRLDYQNSSKKDKNAYLQLFAESGWEYIGARSGWQYFRKNSTLEELGEIFTDTTSKVEKYQRQIGGLIIFIPIYVLLMMNIDYSPKTVIGEILKFLGFVIIVIFIMVSFKLAIRIDRLKKQNIKQ